MPDPVPRPTSVRVPASASNLGPGFDLAGLALSLYLEVRATPRPEAPAHSWRATPADAPWPAPADNLVLRAFDAARTRFGGPSHAFAFDAATEIPLARGLGSSGAAVAAGLRLASALAPAPVSPDALLALGVELEGHPDNVAASLLGGLTLCVPLPDRPPRVVRAPVHPDVRFAVGWPEHPVETARARAVLPARVPFEDAVENPRRLALLLEGLRTADPELLRYGAEDRLHVRYRLPLTPGATQAIEAALDAGAWLATLSGSGSTVLAAGPESAIEGIARALAEAFRRETGTGTGTPVESGLVEWT